MKVLTLVSSSILLAALLGACASSRNAGNEEAERLQALVKSHAGDSIRCISTHQYDSVEIVSEQLLLFKGRQKKVWANELRHRCPGMRKDDILVFDLRNNQVCSLDSVTPTRPGFLGYTGPKCALGEFIEFDMEVLESVKVGLPKL